jgi:hypothetical protein
MPDPALTREAAEARVAPLPVGIVAIVSMVFQAGPFG